MAILPARVGLGRHAAPEHVYAIALGVAAAYGYSVVATLAPGWFPDSFRMGHEIAVYFEPAAVIVALVLLGQVLELRARSNTQPDDRKCGDDLQLGIGHRQRAASAAHRHRIGHPLTA